MVLSGYFFHGKDYLKSTLYFILPSVSAVAVLCLWFVRDDNLFMSECELENDENRTIMTNWWGLSVFLSGLHIGCFILHFIILPSTNMMMYILSAVFFISQFILSILIIYHKKYNGGIIVVFVDLKCFGCFNDLVTESGGGTALESIVINREDSDDDNIDDSHSSLVNKRQSQRAASTKKKVNLVVRSDMNRKYLIEDSDQRRGILRELSKNCSVDKRGGIIITNGWNFETYESGSLLKTKTKNEPMQMDENNIEQI